MDNLTWFTCSPLTTRPASLSTFGYLTVYMTLELQIFYESTVGNVANISDTLQLDANPADIPYYANPFAMSGYVTSTAPIALLVGSTARRVSLTRYDHQAFMPLPITNGMQFLIVTGASRCQHPAWHTCFNRQWWRYDNTVFHHWRIVDFRFLHCNWNIKHQRSFNAEWSHSGY